MTRTIASVTTWLALAAVMLVAGGHTIYYLLEWEWVRAQFAGIVFVAALIVGATMIIIHRMRALERRLDLLVRSSATPAVDVPGPAPAGTASALADPEPRPDFAWLSTSNGWSALALPLLPLLVLREPAPAVFIPVFLATGVAVSVVASGVERLAASRHPDTSAAAGSTAVLAPPRPTRTRTAVGSAVGALLVVGAVLGGLWMTAHYWSAPVGAGTTTLVLEVERNGRVSTDLDVADTMGRYCVLNSGVQVRFGDVAPGPDGQVLLRVSPLLDAEAQNRFGGCLEDAVLDRHRVSVTDVRLAPR